MDCRLAFALVATVMALQEWTRHREMDALKHQVAELQAAQMADGVRAREEKVVDQLMQLLAEHVGAAAPPDETTKRRTQ